MIKSFVKGLEDPDKPLLGPNYKFLQLIGLVLPKSKVGKAAYVLLHELATYFVISQYMELYVIRSDMQEVITNIKISMLSIVCVIKSNTCVLWQDNWIKIFDYITEADKFERDNKDEIKAKIIDRYTKYCRRVTYFYWCLIFTTFLTVTSTPLMRFASSSVYRSELRNGTEMFPQIFSSWMPFDKNHSPGCWITVFWHVFICAYGASVAAAYDSNAIVVMVFFGGQLELLRERCKQMMGSLGGGVSEEEAHKVIKQIHTIHSLLTNGLRFVWTAARDGVLKCKQKYIACFTAVQNYNRKNSRLFNSLLSPVMFLYVVMCSLMLCASAYQLTSATSATQKLLMAEYLVFGVAQLFMFCWHSNDVLMKSENVSLGPYESEWWAGSVRQRKSVLIILGQLRISYIFTAGPFTNLTLSTFITILKGAYSYYTLLRK